MSRMSGVQCYYRRRLRAGKVRLYLRVHLGRLAKQFKVTLDCEPSAAEKMPIGRLKSFTLDYIAMNGTPLWTAT